MATNPNVRNVTTPTKRVVLKVPSPAEWTPENLQKFASSLNAQLALIGDQFSKIPDLPTDFNPDDYLRRVKLSDELDRLEAEADLRFSSENEDDLAGGRVGRAAARRTSRQRRRIFDMISASLADALPDAAPPPVKTASDIGTTDDDPGPIQFALEDHTHSGVAAIRVNSGAEFIRRLVNFIAGTGIVIAAVDDGGDDEVELTIEAEGGGWHRLFTLMGA